MKYRTRTYYSAEQKAEMWDRWQRGESPHSIARLFDRYHTSVRGILAATDGIRPRERRRSSRVLSLAERELISRGIVAGHSIRSIATSLVATVGNAEQFANGRQNVDDSLPDKYPRTSVRKRSILH
jgi:hypothetical protein